jgi:serine/threonine-protein kinase
MPDENRIDDLLDRWEEAQEQGKSISIEEICADTPELLSEMRRRVKMLEAVNQRLETRDSTADTGPLPLGTAGIAGPGAESLLAQIKYGGFRYHAEGGLGVVYVAQDQMLNRDVAIKFLHDRHVQDSESQSRFFREAEITGRLDHPGVVPVHGVGNTGTGTPFYVMRFIRGETLEEAIQRYHQSLKKNPWAVAARLEFRNLLQCFVSVCRTIAYAHNRGIVHRDIKPHNVMLGKYGETLVVDWGLALPVGRDARARASGEMTLMPKSGSSSGESGGAAGTPSYMSPEQAEGIEDIGPSSDIWSLGATLYRLLTGEAPFRGKNAREILQQVRKGKFPPPRTIRKEVPRPLEAICLKAMAAEPKDRYGSALELAEDVENWLGDEHVSAYDEPVGQRLARWARRHRTWVKAGLTGLIALIVVAGGAALLLGRMAGRERDAREGGLLLSARFAARTVGSEIDRRLHILEKEAADYELRQLLIQANAVPDDPDIRTRLKAWLNERFIKYDRATQASSWFIDDADGRLVALALKDSEEQHSILGKSFRHRDYFHGKGRLMKPEELTAADHITDVYRAGVYRSVLKQLKVPFSAPVWSDNKRSRFLGIIALTVEIGRFMELETDLGRNRFAVLVDTKPDWIENDERRGLVLHHPRLRDPAAPREPLRIGTDLLRRFEDLRHLRLQQNDARPAAGHVVPESDDPALDRNYLDPAGGTYQGKWLAAFEPVIVPGRRQEVKDTGWIIIIQERQ